MARPSRWSTSPTPRSTVRRGPLPEGEERWQLLLRCPNCEWEGAGIFDRETVERLDEELDHGTHALLTDLKQLMHANMEEEIERFIAALHAGAILPMDF